MASVADVRRKLGELRRLLAELERDVAALEREQEAPKTAPAEPPAARREGPPPVADLRATYRELYAEFLASGPQVVERFVMARAPDYLAAFCRANRMAEDVSAMPKGRVAVLIVRQMAERRGIERRCRRG